jgi:hypothetical protein
MAKYFVIKPLQEEELFADMDKQVKKDAEKRVREAAAKFATRYIVARSHNDQLRVRNNYFVTIYFNLVNSDDF